MDNLKKLAEKLQNRSLNTKADGSGGIVEEDDDDVPELVAGETFEAVADGPKS